jgi:hypothetical protein
MKMSAPSHQRRCLAIMQVLAALAQNDLADYHKISFRALFEALCLGETPDREPLKRLYPPQTTHFRL